MEEKQTAKEATKNLHANNFLVGVLVILAISTYKYWLPFLLGVLGVLWNFITPTSYTLFLYRDANTRRGPLGPPPDQQINGYSSLKNCQEKGVEFTQKGYAQFSCGERCQDHPIGEISCQNAYY